MLNYTYEDCSRQEAGSSVAYEGQGDAGHRQKAQIRSYINEKLDEKYQGAPEDNEFGVIAPRSQTYAYKSKDGE